MATRMMVLLFLLTASVAVAVTNASERDMAKLQADLSNLDADLATLNFDSLPREERERVDNIRDEVIYLKVKMRKHQEALGEGTGIPLAEVQALRLEIVDLRNDLRKHVAIPAESPGSMTLPSGTEFALRLEHGLSSATANPGDPVEASAVEPVAYEGVVAIEAGSLFSGKVELVDRTEGRTDRKAKLVLAFNRVELHEKGYGLTATVIKASEKLETGIGSEKTKVGIGAGLGTVLGVVLGGKKGALIGAVIGGGGAILATEGKEVELPPGTILYLRLDRELTVSTSSNLIS